MGKDKEARQSKHGKQAGSKAEQAGRASRQSKQAEQAWQPPVHGGKGPKSKSTRCCGQATKAEATADIASKRLPPQQK
jgi:hypothetical protein